MTAQFTVLVVRPTTRPVDLEILVIDPGDVGFVVCPCCGMTRSDVKERHRNTAYANDEQNYMTTCSDCWQQDFDYYKERWDDYHADIYAGLWGG